MTTTDDQTARCEALSERLFDALVDTMELASVYAGLRLGLYQALRDGAPATAAERAGIDERYAREWLEQQAVAGLLEVEGGGDQKARAYRLPAAHAEVLLDPDSPLHAGWAPLWMGSLASVLHRIPETYRTGRGLPTPTTAPTAASPSPT